MKKIFAIAAAATACVCLTILLSGAAAPERVPADRSPLLYGGSPTKAVVDTVTLMGPYGNFPYGGDFETALEGAGHVGDREIAEYLIGQGARANIFVLTMLGHTAVVKAQLAAYPHLLRSKGPHGLTLLHHATRGGEPAKELLEHIQELGLTEMKYPLP